jgi:hypothetical protein
MPKLRLGRLSHDCTGSNNNTGYTTIPTVSGHTAARLRAIISSRFSSNVLTSQAVNIFKVFHQNNACLLFLTSYPKPGHSTHPVSREFEALNRMHCTTNKYKYSSRHKFENITQLERVKSRKEDI